MKLLIIGSKGFIGSNLFNYFNSQNGYQIWQCDVLKNSLNEQNYYTIDSEIQDYEFIFKKIQFDVCINASGNGHVSLSLNNPKHDFVLNTFNVFKMLEAIRVFNVNCKFVNISSAAVYGSPITLPISENHELQPLSPYGFHKMFAEQLCKQYYMLYNLKTCSLRVFSAYGNGLKKQLFWDIYQKYKSTDNKIELYGTGMETRDFIHIDDLIEAINLVILNCEFKSECINIATGIETKIKDATNFLLKQFPLKKEMVFNAQLKKGDPLNWQADVAYLKSLGFYQKISLEEGLSKYSKWVQENQL